LKLENFIGMEKYKNNLRGSLLKEKVLLEIGFENFRS
jgi:hypothetical protein